MLIKFGEDQKNNTPSCIKNNMNEIYIDSIHISFFAVPEKPNS